MAFAKKPKQKGKTQKKGKKLLVILLGALVVAGGLLFYTIGLGPVDSHSEEEILVEIPNGSGASTIVGILDEAGLVKNTFCAKVNSRIGGYNSLQANVYVFSKSMSFREMMDAINTGDFDYISKQEIKILAGHTIPEIAATVSAELNIPENEILAKWSDTAYLKQLIGDYWFLTDDILDENIMYPLEGYFYADSYFLTTADPDIDTATRMFLDRTDTELTSRKDDISKLKMSVHEFLTLTSIVTAEGGETLDDLPTVAGVFMNRLEQGISLGSDVTVNYANQEKKVNISKAGLMNESLYNTRIHPGLPPGPICSVLDSRMDAVIGYEDTDYIFFYACPDGKVIFSKTEAEHEKAARENPWPDDM